MIEEIRNRLLSVADAQDAAFLQRYFKTGPGQYSEGDVFHGIRVPAIRRLVREYGGAIPLVLAEELLHARHHEERLLALLILVARFRKGDDGERRAIFELYLRNTRFINNWDLVDCSAAPIVGGHLDGKDDALLDRLARSTSLWERRIAIMATSEFIRRGSFDVTLRIAKVLLHDREDLIHKAVGWMLREVGKRDLRAEEEFLAIHCREMPRTMLRYAIEKFPEEKRRRYLKGEVAVPAGEPMKMK